MAITAPSPSPANDPPRSGQLIGIDDGPAMRDYEPDQHDDQRDRARFEQEQGDRREADVAVGERCGGEQTEDHERDALGCDAGET